jgi:hypothetical protein
MKPRCATTLLGGGRVLGHGLGAFRHGVLGQLAGEDKSDTACGLARVRRVIAEEIRTRSGFRVMRWSTSCCRRQAWRPRWQRAQRCLQLGQQTPRGKRRTMRLPLTKELRMLMARLLIPVSGCTCLRTATRQIDVWTNVQKCANSPL